MHSVGYNKYMFIILQGHKMKLKRNYIFVNMPHRTHNCTTTLYDYAIIINTYVNLMHELKKNWKVTDE